MRYGFHAGQVDWPRDVTHGSTTKAHGSKHVTVGTLICWLVLGPSYFSERVVQLLCSVFFSVFWIFLQYFVVCTGKRYKEKGTHPHFDVPVSPYPWSSSDPRASASAPADELAKQLPASASSLAVPLPAASTAEEAVDLPAGAAIRGLPLLVLLLRRVQASSPAKKLNAGVTCIKFSFYRTSCL